MDNPDPIQIRIIFIALLIGMAVAFALCLNACTISFQNISTHGTATDLVDENQKAESQASPNLSIPNF